MSAVEPPTLCFAVDLKPAVHRHRAASGSAIEPPITLRAQDTDHWEPPLLGFNPSVWTERCPDVSSDWKVGNAEGASITFLDFMNTPQLKREIATLKMIDRALDTGRKVSVWDFLGAKISDLSTLPSVEIQSEGRIYTLPFPIFVLALFEARGLRITARAMRRILGAEDRHPESLSRCRKTLEAAISVHGSGVSPLSGEQICAEAMQAAASVGLRFFQAIDIELANKSMTEGRGLRPTLVAPNTCTGFKYGSYFPKPIFGETGSAPKSLFDTFYTFNTKFKNTKVSDSGH